MKRTLPCIDCAPIDWFPPPDHANEDGLLCYGGELATKRLISAYNQGIFPWPIDDLPMLWWCTHPRLVLQPNKIHIGRTLKKELGRHQWKLTSDKCFKEVIGQCAQYRHNGSWITSQMQEAYIALHQQGYAHSIEIWLDDSLVSGLYGVAIGKVFFGESIFSRLPNAGKIALTALARLLVQNDYWLIDCQTSSPLLVSFGARTLSLGAFIRILKSNKQEKGRWDISADSFQHSVVAWNFSGK